jgi:hypothetical protein
MPLEPSPLGFLWVYSHIIYKTIATSTVIARHLKIQSQEVQLHKAQFHLNALRDKRSTGTRALLQEGLLHHGETGLLPSGLWSDLNFTDFFE